MTVKLSGNGIKGVHVHEVIIERAEKLDCTIEYSSFLCRCIEVVITNLKRLLLKKWIRVAGG
jgi:hypothetical protein